MSLIDRPVHRGVGGKGNALFGVDVIGQRGIISVPKGTGGVQSGAEEIEGIIGSGRVGHINRFRQSGLQPGRQHLADKDARQEAQQQRKQSHDKQSRSLDHKKASFPVS